MTGTGSLPFRMTLAALAAALCLSVGLTLYNTGCPPMEDAAMLLRYSRNLAEGHGMRWNPDEAPVDGATDFLYTVAIAAVMKAGPDAIVSARILNTASHLGLVILLCICIPAVHRISWVWGLGAALFIAVGPGHIYTETGFGANVFALAATFAAWRAWLIFRGDHSRKNLLSFAIAALVTGLVRPEGVFLCGFIFIALFALTPGLTRKNLLVTYATGMIIPGALYFAWRWIYFGHPLPNPFYIKGTEGLLYPYSAKTAFLHFTALTKPWLPLIALLFIFRSRWREGLFVWIPLGGFILIWLMMALSMNHYMRYHYVSAPLFLLGMGAWVDENRMREWAGKWNKIAGITAAGLLVLIPLVWQLRFSSALRKTLQVKDGRADAGLALEPFAGKGYVMAVTEAGNLPYYSRWKAVDTWGLNDAFIAHNKVITLEYLEKKSPVLMMLHDETDPRTQTDSNWAVMLDVMRKYAAAKNMALVAKWTHRKKTSHYYYLDRNCPDFDTLSAILRKPPYWWAETGEACIDMGHTTANPLP